MNKNKLISKINPLFLKRGKGITFPFSYFGGICGRNCGCGLLYEWRYTA